MMSRKERFMGTLLGEGADRFPFFDLEPSDETVMRWRREGLPPDKSVAQFFNLEPHHSVGLTLRSYPYYQKASRLLLDPASFNGYYNIDEHSRYVEDWVTRGRDLAQAGEVLYVDASGGGLLQMLGVGDWNSLLTACRALMEKPGLVEDLLDRTTDFYCACLERVLSRVPVDYATFYEPIASNTGPVISPSMFDRFAMPGYRKVLSLLERFEVPLRVFCTTGGDLTSLLPPLIEAGINGLWISNIKSTGMEYAALRRVFGPEVSLIGGIDAGALTRDPAAVHRAVEETVPHLLESGHYLPCLDDRPRPNIAFEQYQLFRELLSNYAQQVAS